MKQTDKQQAARSISGRLTQRPATGGDGQRREGAGGRRDEPTYQQRTSLEDTQQMRDDGPTQPSFCLCMRHITSKYVSQQFMSRMTTAPPRNLICQIRFGLSGCVFITADEPGWVLVLSLKDRLDLPTPTRPPAGRYRCTLGEPAAAGAFMK